MDNKLLEILCCPVSKRPVNRLEQSRLDALNEVIGKGEVTYVNGDTVDETFDEALVTDDDAVIYGVKDGIPVMLPERGVGTTQFEDFAAGRM